MKKMMMAVAVAAACGLSAVAAEWFNGGITSAWPDAAGMNGVWLNTEGAELMATDPVALDVDADDAAPLAFAANVTNTIGSTAQSVTIKSEIEFSPFEELPPVPAEAKAGVAVLETNIYVLAKDGSANVWTNTEITVGDDFVKVEMTVGNGTVTYKFDDKTFGPVAIELGDGTVAGASYSGCGVVKSLVGECEPLAVAFTVQTNADATNVVVKVDGEPVSGPEYYALPGAALEVIYTANEGKFFGNGSSTYKYEGKVTAGEITTDVDKQGLTDAAAKIGATYYPTLKAAFDASQDNDEIVLWSCTTSSATATNTMAGVVLDLNGYTYEYADTGYLLSVNDGDLTIKDTKGNGELLKATQTTVVQVTNAVLVLKSGTIHYNGTNTDKSSGVIVNVKTGGQFTMDGGKLWVENKVAENAIRSAVANGAVVNGGYVDGGFELCDVGTISVAGGQFTVDPTAYLATGKAADEESGVWTVRDAVAATGVTLDKTGVTNKVSEVFTLTATVAPANADVKSIVWASSAEAVAVVTNGEVTAVAAGEATITVTVTDCFGDQFEATCKVTVEAAGGSAVVPGESVKVKTEEEAAKVEVALDDNQKDLSADQQAEYKGLFDRVVTPDGAGGYNVTFVPSAQTSNEVAQAVVAVEKAILAKPGAASTPTIATKPGLYYSVATGTDVTQKLTEGARTMATGTEMQLSVPAVGTTQGFYQILVNVTSGIVQ